jgi:hypothetical protein
MELEVGLGARARAEPVGPERRRALIGRKSLTWEGWSKGADGVCCVVLCRCRCRALQGVPLEQLHFKRVLFGGFPCYSNGPLPPAFDRVMQASAQAA